MTKTEGTASIALPDALRDFDQLPDSAHVRLRIVGKLRGTSDATTWRHVKAGILPAPKKFGRVSSWNVGQLRQSLGIKREAAN
jgi:predicted DNA-binding transcriptional regulator AlpA